jgi:hypothetical protein
VKIFNAFIKIFIWIGAMALIRFLVEYWIATQRYSLYAITTGLVFFIIVAYFSYKELKV